MQSALPDAEPWEFTLMQLSDKQKRVISSVQLQAKAPIAQIAEETGYRPHVVSHILDYLKEKKILTAHA